MLLWLAVAHPLAALGLAAAVVLLAVLVFSWIRRLIRRLAGAERPVAA